MNLQNQIEYLKLNNLDDMFSDCSVPVPLDMQRVRGAIIMRCGLLTPLYSEPEVQRDATQQFFFENQWNFEHIVKILNAEYSPIENVAEERTETTRNSGTDSLTISRNSSEQHTGQDVNQESGQTIITREVSAENATTYQADNKETEAHGKGDTLTHNHTITNAGNDTHRSEKDGRTDYTVSRHGNIGVTTNQDMINQELDLMQRFNPYRFIADLYEKELMLGIY